MDHQNIRFHNVEELEPVEGGWLLRRVGAAARARISPGVQENYFATGIELRFTMPDGAVDLLLKTIPQAEAATAHIFFGSFQGGWEYSSKNIGADVTRIHIEYPAKLATLRRITAEKQLAFAPEVVRVVLPYVPVIFAGVESRTALPAADQLPQKTYLAYGSSITHGSLSLIQPDCYVFRNAQALGVDYLNLGFAGNALMEEEMANYLVSRRDWDFASVEMSSRSRCLRSGSTASPPCWPAIRGRCSPPRSSAIWMRTLTAPTRCAGSCGATPPSGSSLPMACSCWKMRPLSRQTAPTPMPAGRSRSPHAGAASWRKRLPTARRGEFFGRLSFCTKLGVKIHKILTFAIRAFALTLPSLHGTIK